MRFKVRKRGDFWAVVDATDGAIVGKYRKKEQAEKRAAALNANPPPKPGPKRQWKVALTGQTDTLEALLEEGWEPYAVDSGIHYLRLKIKQGGGGGQPGRNR